MGIHRCLADPVLADCRNAGLRGAALCGTAAASGNDELIVGSEDGIDPVSLAALTRKVGRKVRYVIVLRGQIVTGLRHWYARRRGHDPRAMLYNAVQHQWLTEQQTGEIWRQYVPHQFLFAEILTTLGHINRSAINVLLLRHERSSLPLGKFWSPKVLSARKRWIAS